MDELEISGKRYISTKRAGKDHKYHSDYIGQLIRAKKVAGQKVGRAWYVDADSLAEYLGAEVQKAADTGSPVARMVKSTPIQTPPVAVEAAPVKKQIIQPEPEPETVAASFVEEVEEVIEEVLEVVEGDEVEDSSASYIPIKIAQTQTPIYRTTKEAREARGGLRYVTDEGPLLPQIKKHTVYSKHEVATPKAMHDEAPTTRINIRNAEPVVERESHVIFEEGRSFNTAPVSKRRSVKQNSIALFAVRAGVVLALGAVIFAIVAFASTHLLFTETIDGGGGASAGYSVK